MTVKTAESRRPLRRRRPALPTIPLLICVPLWLAMAAAWARSYWVGDSFWWNQPNRVRAVAVAEVQGPHAGLTAIETLDLPDYYLFHAIRADLLRRLGRLQEAADAYRCAIERTANAAERAFLERRLSALS